MIHKTLLIILLLLLCLKHENEAVQCLLNGTSCIFSEVNTTKARPLFHPSSVNNNKVQKIQFKRSSMYILTEEICETFPNLTELRIINVSLGRITSNALHGCRKLTFIHVSMNNITDLPLNLFEKNRDLYAVVLQNNHLKSIDGRMFAHLKSLTHLAVPENYLDEFPVYQFPVLDKLTSLYIYENDITDLDEQELLLKFPNLKHIYMHNNLFDCDRLKIVINALRRNGIEFRQFDKHIRTRNSNLSTIENIECMTKDEHVTRIVDSKLSNTINLRKQLGISALEEEMKSQKKGQLEATVQYRTMSDDKFFMEVLNNSKYNELIISDLTEKHNSLMNKNTNIVILASGLILLLFLIFFLTNFLIYYKVKRTTEKQLRYQRQTNHDVDNDCSFSNSFQVLINHIDERPQTSWDAIQLPLLK